MEFDIWCAKKKEGREKEQHISKDTLKQTGRKGSPIYVDDSPTELIMNPGEGLKKKQLPTVRSRTQESREASSYVGEQRDTTIDLDPPQKKVRWDDKIPEDKRPPEISKLFDCRANGLKIAERMYSYIRGLSGLSVSLQARASDHIGLISDVLRLKDRVGAEKVMQLIELVVKSWSLSVRATEGSGSVDELMEEFFSSMNS